jgi:hypothetical protein
VAAVTVRRDGGACAKWPNDNPAVCASVVMIKEWPLLNAYEPPGNQR